ncbi:diaminopimelate decarboxylase [Bacteroidota bacterium]
MIENIPRPAISSIFRQALQEGLIRDEDTAVLFHDLDYLRSRITYLTSCFPSTTLHGLAIKSNPLLRILEFTRELGCGVEAATTGEIVIALKAGYPADQIVFDSPVKTIPDLQFAMKKGVHINCDNLEELKRVDILLKDTTSSATFGIRINPQIGVGSILESSVAGEYSKFGVPINTKREELVNAFQNYPWLSGVHLHVGSQGCAMEMLVEGVGVLYDFVSEINEIRKKKNEIQISIFDIGGGFPISYSYQQTPPRMEDYVAALLVRTPGLFESTEPKGQADKRTSGQADKQTSEQGGEWRIITEFGRWVFVNSGFTVSRVEYVKRDPGINTAMIHVGADLFVRECLNPADWKHEYTLLDSQGNLKKGQDANPYNLAGPLCFAGDIVAKNVVLPVVDEGDYIVIHDTGGYTFSMWSRYNSRQTPRILGILDGKFRILKEREGLEELVGLWE